MALGHFKAKTSKAYFCSLPNHSIIINKTTYKSAVLGKIAGASIIDLEKISEKARHT